MFLFCTHSLKITMTANVKAQCICCIEIYDDDVFWTNSTTSITMTIKTLRYRSTGILNDCGTRIYQTLNFKLFETLNHVNYAATINARLPMIESVCYQHMSKYIHVFRLCVNDAVLAGDGSDTAHGIIVGGRRLHLGISHWLSRRLQLLL